MRHPLVLVSAGLLLVIFDFRTESLDLLLDPVGWTLVAAGAALSSLRAAAWLAGAAAVLSASDAYLPFREVVVDPLTGKSIRQCPAADGCGTRIEFDPVSGWRLAALAAAILFGGAAVLTLALRLRTRALAAGDAVAGHRLGLLLGAVGLGWVGPPILAVVWSVLANDGSYDPIWSGTAEYVALIGWALMMWFLIELFARSDTPWATPRSTPAPSPWSQRGRQ